MSLKSINPYTHELLYETAELTEPEVEKILVKSGIAFEGWKRTAFSYRSGLMRNVSRLLIANTERYARVITTEMGKPLKESKAEVEKCAWVCDYYADNAEKFLSSETIDTDADRSYVLYEPLGTVLGIMPWNFPFWQVFRFAVPTIMAGNTVLLKHASNVQQCGRLIEEIFDEAGFPASLFSNLALGSSSMDKVIRHNVIKAVSLTGSESAGIKVAETAAGVLKKCVLELGGSNAYIVLDDADLTIAATTAVRARFQNAGQSCIAAKRFIVHSKIHKEFIEKFTGAVRNLKTGDPMDPSTELGPLCSISQAEAVEDQLRRSISKGARVVEGGTRSGAFFRPTIVADVIPGMPLFDEEVFGPIAALSVVDTLDEAVTLADKTTFGLGVSIFSNNIRKAAELAREFHDGSVFINGMVKSDPRLPFGGTRRSGYGRELSIQGIREFVNVKSVWIKETGKQA